MSPCSQSRTMIVNNINDISHTSVILHLYVQASCALCQSVNICAYICACFVLCACGKTAGVAGFIWCILTLS